MESLLKIILLCTAFFLNVFSVQAEEPIRVLSFNVLCARWDKPEYSWEKRKEIVLDVMKNPTDGKPYDFIGTQEVNRDPQKPELEQLQYLLDGLPEYAGHYTLINGSFEKIPHSLVDLILYRKDRWEIDPEDQGHFWMSDTPEIPGSNTWEHKGDVARCMGYALFHELGPAGRTGKKVYVYNTHLNSRVESHRIRSILLIMDRISKRKQPDVPVIVTGDFNSKHDTPHIRYMQGETMEFEGKTYGPPLRLLETYKFVHPNAASDQFGTAHEYKGKNQDYKIDFIFASPSLEPIEAKVIDTQRDGLYPSDHYPIEAVLRWNNTVLFAPEAEKTGGANGIWSVSLKEPGRRNAAVIPVPTELIAGKNILLAAEIEQQDISEKPNHWNGVKLLLELTDADGKKHYPQALNSPGTLPWTPHAVAVTVPSDIRDAKICLALENVSGSARFRKVRIIEDIPLNYDGYLMTGSMNKSNAEYQAGEEMLFNFRLTKNGKPATGSARVVCAADDGKTDVFYKQFDESGTIRLQRTLEQPGFVMVKTTLLTPHGTPAQSGEREIQYGLGAGVTAETLRQGVPEPEDFDAYWKTQKERLDAVPIEVLEKKLHKETDRCFIYDIKIKGIGERPVSGYLSVPKNAKARMLPLRLSYGGYSFLGANAEENVDRITLNVNPHGIENGREQSYYDALQRGELANYGFRDEENQKPETCYFNNMVLRDLRALQFGRTLPEWDGKTIEISGGSQGAFRTMAVAALSEGITRCDIRVPWLCDLGGIKLGRVRGWRPNLAPGLGYFDTVNFAKRVKCPVEISAGLTDWVCPPSGVCVLYNNLNVPAKLTLFQGLDHGGYPGYDQCSTPRTVYSK